MDYDAVVFDNDGVLTRLTDWGLVREAIRDTFQEFGADPTDDHVERILRGTPERVRQVAAAHDLDPEELWARREANAAAAQREAMELGEKPLYDDHDALTTLRTDYELPLGVVSNNQHETVRHVVDVHGLDDLFGAVYGREPHLEGIRRKKPKPYYIERALSDLNAERALYVGDSDCDVRAARNAGIDSAFVRRDHRADYALDSEPTHEIESLRELAEIV